MLIAKEISEAVSVALYVPETAALISGTILNLKWRHPGLGFVGYRKCASNVNKAQDRDLFSEMSL